MTLKIGVMDSGVGGFTILKAIKESLPHAEILYFADQAYAPYGNLDASQIAKRLFVIGDYFLSQGCDVMVVACNTATVVSIHTLRARIKLPVVGVEPAVKPACTSSAKKSVSVLATPVTARSERLNELINTWRFDANVEILFSETLADMIDHMPGTATKVEQEIRQLCDRIMAHNSDSLVLACTHYPLVKSSFENCLGADVVIIEPSLGVASQVVRMAADKAKQSIVSRMGALHVYSNGREEQLRSMNYWLLREGFEVAVERTCL